MHAITEPPPTSAELPPAGLPALVRRAAGGDEGAWRELVSLYSRRVYALALSRLRAPDAAQDLTQSVFMTLAEQFAKGAYTETGRFEAWLFRIANNRIRDEAKRTQRTPLRLSDHDHEAHTTTTTSDEELTALRAAIERLSPAEQELLSLRHQAQLSFKAIATLLDEPLGTTLARHHRALGKLKDLLTEPHA